MNLEQTIHEYKKRYQVLKIIDLNQWFDLEIFRRESWICNLLTTVHKDAFNDNDRLLFTITHSNQIDVLKNLQHYLTSSDITNFFVVLLTNQSNIDDIKKYFHNTTDTTEITIEYVDEIIPTAATKISAYNYASADPVKISLNSLTGQEKFLLSTSKTFCIYPWIHTHAYPTGVAYPCCHAEMRHSVGNTRNNTLKEIWNSNNYRQLRINMLTETPSPACNRCYEQEESGFFSGRRSANKHHGHHINRVQNTQPDGYLEQFEMTYWDIRFSNLCNLKCRSCGHIFSSQWYQDQAKLAGGDWKERNTVLNYAGRTETDMWEQLEPHLDYVEQIYFAGGEPLLMEEHYNILKELIQRKRFNVRLIYNTNFTHTDLKGESVFEYWKLFDNVAVGASLDDSGTRGEYIRKGTNWPVVEQNRRDMLRICPNVDFYISPTLSIMNALHLPDFHRDWVEKGLLKPQDLNINILQDPPFYRIDIATPAYKQKIQDKFEEHINWLRPQDQLNRATIGFESAIKFMNATDNQQLLKKFWDRTHELDAIRKENIIKVIPEINELKL